jgi:hypothetical protein
MWLAIKEETDSTYSHGELHPDCHSSQARGYCAFIMFRLAISISNLTKILHAKKKRTITKRYTHLTYARD